MSQKFLVTGGLGFIGSGLVKALVKAGHQVRSFDNSSRGSADRLGDVAHDVENMEGDIRDPVAVRKAMKGMDGVWHLAFVNGTEFFYKYPAYVLDVGVKGMVNVLDAAIQEEVPEFILASSSEVYQTAQEVPTNESVPLLVPDVWNPRYSYGGGKMISELMAINYAREHFQRMMIFRPHNVYGPMMGWEHVIPQFIVRLKEMSASGSGVLEFPIQGNGRQTRAFIYIDDFVKGLLLMHQKGEHMNLYHIGTMDEVTIADIALHIATAMDLTIKVIPGAEADGATVRRCPDTQKMQSLGFSPAISLQEGLQPTVQWYSHHLRPTGSMPPPSLFFHS